MNIWKCGCFYLILGDCGYLYDKPLQAESKQDGLAPVQNLKATS